MKKRRISCLLMTVVMLLGMNGVCYGQSDAFEFGEALSKGTEIGAGMSGMGDAMMSGTVEGSWFWGLLGDATLLSGTTAVSSDANVRTTIYAGGPGYIAVSRDSGTNWLEVLKLDSKAEDVEVVVSEEGEEENELRTVSGLTVSQLREYLQNELEQQFDATEAEGMLERITDEDLSQATDMRELEGFDSIELDMETDLTEIDAGTSVSVRLNDFDDFMTRYMTAVYAGAQPEDAARVAGDRPGVWSFVSKSGRTFAVTSDRIYATGNQGESWSEFYESPEEASILSFALSDDGQFYAIGLTTGLLMTRNGGGDWVMLRDVFGGAVHEINMLGGSEIVVTTTGGVYRSADVGLTWTEEMIPLEETEYLVSLVPGQGRSALAVTSDALYITRDGEYWNSVDCGPFEDEVIRQAVVTDPSLNRFIVRTDIHVFEYDGSRWLSQNKSLMASDLGNLSLTGDGISFAVMASASGVWMAQDKAYLEMSDEYKELFAQWSKEPSDALVVEKALEAHYLGEMAEKNWGLRSRLSWLLPLVTFDYIYKQQRTDRVKRVLDEMKGYITSEVFTQQRQTQSTWQIMAHWNINIAEGVKDELDGEKTSFMLRQRRDAVVKAVLGELKKRRAFQMTLALDLPKRPDSKATRKKFNKTWLGLQEAEANLHALTGGYYIPAVHQDTKQ